MIKKVIEKIVIIFAIITVGFIAISNLFFRSNILNDVSEQVDITQITTTILAISFVIIGIILAIGVFTKKINFTKKTKIILLVCAIILYIIVNVLWIQTTKVEPVADQKVVHELAQKIANGEEEQLKKSEYLERNPQQIGTSYFIATIYNIFNSTNHQIIQYINVLCNIVSIIFMYLIMKQFLKEYKFNTWIYFIISFTFMPLILLSTFVYGDYIGLMLSCVGIYMIMKYADKQKVRYLFVSAMLLALSYIVKSNYLIFVLAIIIYLVLDFLKKKDWKKILFIALFILITLLPNTILKNVISNKLELDKNRSIPTSAYIYMGMNEGSRSNGWYNQTMDYAWTNIDDARTHYPERIKERVTELVESPLYTVKFYAKKVISMWTEVQFGSIWYNLPFQANNHEEFLNLMSEDSVFLSVCQGKVNSMLEIFQRAIVLLLLLGTLLAIWKNRKDINLNLILLLTIFLGGFFFHIIWEAKSRYILPYVFILIPVSIIGIEEVINKLFVHINKRKQTKLKEK